MKQNRLLLSILLLISMLACAIPGLDAQAPSAANPNMISTIVVSTANAAASQTAEAQPFAAETPADAAVSEEAGTIVELLPDGTTKYDDYDAGFEITFPNGWLAIRPSSDEFNTALAKADAGNPVLHDQMTTDMAGYDASVDRLYSYVLRPDIEKNAIFGFSKLAWDSDDTTSLSNATMGGLIRDLESSGDIPGFRADTAQLHENGNAVEIIEIGGRFTISDGQGGTIPLYATFVFFKPASNSLARITFTVLQDYNAQISTDVKSIIESIKVVGL